MAPLAMTIKNSNVMIPVILYRMLIATAVVGGGPLAGPPLLFPPLFEGLCAMVAGRVLFAWSRVDNVFESLLEVME